nr:phosphomannomutase/phosphoglucomutase [Gemmatimonadota bacterium]NIS02564.1 phosphomannomutase/phosphoglucomutase [Gemmatimonadota bacterium]NIT68440.1 phosphomannomutase/phosphoglucomutase [Gemmatimonadota bacterium]NIU51892.1 phosphomannomutase/phosphoglucomutase [Gemmatimonadota bacterium]NIV24995.1 phosphomannomutase/phosphoglucomutase [Gemmatimonadota bacterium]
MPDLNPHIFREYDIRGIVGEDLTPEIARAVGRAFGSEVAGDGTSPTIVLGHDNRPSSPELAG